MMLFQDGNGRAGRLVAHRYVPYAYHSFNGTSFGICNIEKFTEDFITPGATYEETCAGHKINVELRDITN